MTVTAAFPFADVELARRLERAEAESSVSFVDARARLAPDRGAVELGDEQVHPLGVRADVADIEYEVGVASLAPSLRCGPRVEVRFGDTHLADGDIAD
jgi:hypothetical protein